MIEFIFLTILVIAKSKSEIALRDDITEDTVLSSTYTYKIENDITVTYGVKLTITEGTSVVFCDVCILYVNGSISMIGSSEEKIRMRGEGFEVHVEGELVMKHTIFEGHLCLHEDGGVSEITGSEFSNSQICLATERMIHIDESSFFNCIVGIYSVWSTTVTNTYFYQNYHGILFQYEKLDSKVTIERNEFLETYHNAISIESEGEVVISNNNFSRNYEKVLEIISFGEGEVYITQNVFSCNAGYEMNSGYNSGFFLLDTSNRHTEISENYFQNNIGSISLYFDEDDDENNNSNPIIFRRNMFIDNLLYLGHIFEDTMSFINIHISSTSYLSMMDNSFENNNIFKDYEGETEKYERVKYFMINFDYNIMFTEDEEFTSLVFRNNTFNNMDLVFPVFDGGVTINLDDVVLDLRYNYWGLFVPNILDRVDIRHDNNTNKILVSPGLFLPSNFVYFYEMDRSNRRDCQVVDVCHNNIYGTLEKCSWDGVCRYDRCWCYEGYEVELYSYQCKLSHDDDDDDEDDDSGIPFSYDDEEGKEDDGSFFSNKVVRIGIIGGGVASLMLCVVVVSIVVGKVCCDVMRRRRRKRRRRSRDLLTISEEIELEENHPPDIFMDDDDEGSNSLFLKSVSGGRLLDEEEGEEKKKKNIPKKDEDNNYYVE